VNEKIVPRDALTKEEEKLHSEFVSSAEEYQTFLKNLFRGKTSTVKKKEKPKQTLVRFLQEVPEIIGSDMKPYGPFRAEDVATLPTENARILISQGAAVEVETK
jgi:DNA replication factor GINS